MTRIWAALAVSILALGGTVRAAGNSILFVGNSFTFAFGSPVRFYRADTVTDLNNEGIGPKVTLFLMATWSRADEVYQPKGAWAGQSIDVMGRDVRAA
jgi:hypothetical protein